jgi:glycosyltransferase involved in cell wall biosynthesis
LNINLISRKTTKQFFSIEKVFGAIQHSISPSQLRISHFRLPFTGNGGIGIFGNLLYLSLIPKKGIFHVTGHVHYAILALPTNRSILTIHDLVFLHSHTGIRKKIIKYLFLDLPVRKANYITTISEKSKKEIIDSTGCNPSKIHVIPNPVHPIFTPRSPKPISNIPVLLFIGTFPNKNLEQSIAAVSGLPIHLRIIGPLSDNQIFLLKKWTIQYSQTEKLSDQELAHEYQNADILLFPSLYEGFGLPIIEAFQSGLPVITSEISPMKEVASEAALLIDPNSISAIRNAVITLTTNHEFRESLISKGHEAVKKYQPNFIADQYKTLWQHVWDKRNTSLQ